MPGLTHHMLVSIATGLVLLCSTVALAEKKDTIIADPNVQRTDTRTSDLRNSGLTGGFYADKYKGDDWYYDFYEGLRRGNEAQSAGRKEAQSAGGKKPSQPWERRHTPRRCRPRHRS